MYKSLVIGIVFLLGLYFISQSNKVETFITDDVNPHKIAENCPDVLIQKGSTIFLYNSKRAGVAGVNPIRFENLDEYTEFVEWQRKQGILCPILFLQHAYNAQGESVYKARPSPTNLQGGLPDFYVTNKIANPNMMPPPSTAVPIQGLLANTTCGDIIAGRLSAGGVVASSGVGKKCLISACRVRRPCGVCTECLVAQCSITVTRI